MLIKSVIIEGFRGYSQSARLDFAVPNGKIGSGLTIIVGPNNSGKSSLIETFKSRREYGLPSFNVGMRNRRSDSVRIEFVFMSHTEVVRSIRPGSSEVISEGVKLNSAPVYFVPYRRYFSPAFGRGHPAKRSDFINNYATYNAERSPQLAQFEGRLTQIERDQAAFNKVIGRIIPGLLEWSIDQHETGQYFLKFTDGNKSHSSEGVGEGVTSAFVIAASLYDSSAGDVIVIDEPELSLHPQVQKRLMTLLEEYAADRQIILSTHSPYFLTNSAIEGGCAVCRCWDRDGTIELFTLSTSHPSSVLSKLMTSNLNNPHVFGLDAREVFFLEDGVLIFEGQEDVVLWPKITEQLGAPAMQAYGWGAGGAENITYVLGTLQGLGFRKVAAVFDADKKLEQIRVSEQFPDFMVTNIPADDIRSKKPVQAREAKEGLLDTQMKIRGNYVEECRTLVAKLAEFIE